MVIYTNFFLLSREFVLAVPPPLFRATSNSHFCLHPSEIIDMTLTSGTLGP
jgi:hypothetical protein